MLRTLAVLFGILFIFIGVAGFMPTFNTNGFLFGYLTINPMHNFVHLVTGVLAIMAATQYRYTKFYFSIVGLIYILMALVGFWRGDLFFMHVTLTDNIFHLIIGVIFVYLGFAVRSRADFA